MTTTFEDDNAWREAIAGCLLGTAVGDSIGLPYENLARAAVARVARWPLEQSLLWGRGLVSDDTEHTWMLAESLVESGPDVDRFLHRLASRLRWWLLAGPPGVGAATARAILKLWLGVSPARSGIHSAGNGAAMRAALLGLVWREDDARLVAFVEASSRLTHADPRASQAALAVALAARCAARVRPRDASTAWGIFQDDWIRMTGGGEALRESMDALREAVRDGDDVEEFAARLGCARGVTGYALHTVPVALHAWMRHPQDLRTAVEAVVRCGGDTDSTAAIVGAIVGSGVGPSGVPASWLSRLPLWPRDVAWMLSMAKRLAAVSRGGEPTPRPWRTAMRAAALWPWTLSRNLAMFGIVLYVAGRRTVRRFT